MADYIDIDNIVTPTDWIPDVSPIKVIGVGGCGCNAVTYMYNQKVQGCNFIVCNTDRQALEKSKVDMALQYYYWSYSLIRSLQKPNEVKVKFIFQFYCFEMFPVRVKLALIYLRVFTVTSAAGVL